MQRNRSSGLGLLLLANQLFNVGFDRIPPVTLAAIALQVCIFLGVFVPPGFHHPTCISVESILYYEDYRLLIVSALVHASDFHLYYNMVSLISKGMDVEKRVGSIRYAIMLLLFTITTSCVYVALAKIAADQFDRSYLRQCALGFSGVLFALKVVSNSNYSNRRVWMHGFLVPAGVSFWIELVLIQLIVPNSSFIGHLAGILTGLLYTQGPLKFFIDVVMSLIPMPQTHIRTDRNTSETHYGYSQGTYRRESGVSGYRDDTYNRSYNNYAPSAPP